MMKAREWGPMACSWCGEVLTMENTSSSKRSQQRKHPKGWVFCSTTCGWASRGQAVGEANKVHAPERMRKRNPMRHAATRQKVSDTLRAIGHKPKDRGGNGAAVPKAQQVLFDALTVKQPGDWAMEYVVATAGAPPRLDGGRWPYHYRIDIASPSQMVAIEVDGQSHCPLERKDSDARKDRMLRHKGWTVIRFSNKAVFSQLSECLSAVASTTSP